MRNSILRNFYSILLLFFSTALFAHGVIESPPSRQQFCGVETKPHDIFGTVTHEKCRPILTKEDGSMDNSIYNFMGVLTHTTGRQGRVAENLPKNVCGFDSETWGGGKTPWDAANDWPTSTLKSGTNQFVWNIRWGNHFGDTEEFVFYITKPDFVFDKNRELTWDDFENTPFCVLKYNDADPTGNPNVVADKAQDKFFVTCAVPHRDSEMMLDGTQSQGDNITYQWSVNAKESEYYTLMDANKAQARLVMRSPVAEQVVTVNLTVTQEGFTSMASKNFRHLPQVVNTWQLVGDTTTSETLKAGDKVKLRVIDKDGYDYYLPQDGLVLNAETAKPQNWSYALAQEVNDNNDFDLRVGVLNASSNTVNPVHSATDNKIYVGQLSNVKNAYVQFEKQDVPVPCGCKVNKKDGANPYWLGYDVYSDFAPIVLDFSETGINLNNVIVDQGVFGDVVKLSETKLLINHKPQWVSKSVPGYIGFRANNYAPLGTNLLAACQSG